MVAPPNPASERGQPECRRVLPPTRRQHRNVLRLESYRSVNVRVGSHIAPEHQVVPELIKRFWRALPKLDAWQAHNKFEAIHPFEDLNGRTGRLIWLHKAVDEGYAGQISFLHRFYYDTLSHTRTPKL